MRLCRCLSRQADVIVVGDVISVLSNEGHSTIRLRVLRCVSGKQPTGSSLSVRVNGPVLDATQRDQYRPRLWFLRSGTVLPRIVNIDGIDGYSLPVGRPETYRRLARDSVLRGLALELVAVLKDGNADAGTQAQIKHYLESKPAVQQSEAARQLLGGPRN